jgi:hypothetical protein
VLARTGLQHGLAYCTIRAGGRRKTAFDVDLLQISWVNPGQAVRPTRVFQGMAGQMNDAEFPTALYRPLPLGKMAKSLSQNGTGTLLSSGACHVWDRL